jgi:hypothetical protein
MFSDKFSTTKVSDEVVDAYLAWLDM